MGKTLIFFFIREGLPNMTLQPIPSGFPYIRGKFCVLFYQCMVEQIQYVDVKHWSTVCATQE
jgi:hypothetical protein